MTVLFKSIVKNENSLPEGREIFRGSYLGAPIPLMARSEPNDKTVDTKESCKVKEIGVRRRAMWFCHQ
jgi:hypothetical protein